MREDIDRKFLTLKHATEELNLDIKEQLKVTQIAEKRSLSSDVAIYSFMDFAKEIKFE